MTLIYTNNNKTNYTINNLINNVTYNVRVAAINSVGQGPFTPWVSGTPGLLASDNYYYDNVLLMHFDDPGIGTFDPYGDYVPLLLHMDGANGSTTFTDSSWSPKTVTGRGGAIISTTQSKFGGSSFYGNGSTSGLAIKGNNNDLVLSGDFTIECWVMLNNLSASQSVCQSLWGDGGFMLFHHQNYAGKISFWVWNYSRSEPMLVSSSSFTAGTWRFVSVTRYQNTWSLFVDGVLEATTNSAATIMQSDVILNAVGEAERTPYIYIGVYRDAWFSTGYSLDGYIDDFRITKGLARYTANFNSPTEAFPGPVVFIDSSTYNNKIISSAIIYSDNSKFGGYAGYFNGSSYARSAGTDIWQLGSRDFTIESWINPDTVTNTRSIVGNYDGADGGWRLAVGSPVGDTSLLLHFDGYDGSTNFVDSSSNALTVTANGAAAVSTSVTKWGTGSLSLGGSGDFLTTSTSSAFNLSGDFTVECWIYPTQSASANRSILHINAGWNIGLHVYQYGTNLRVDNGIVADYDGANLLTANTWQHVAVSRSGSTVNVYVNGTQVASRVAQSYGTPDRVQVGRFSTGGITNDFAGYIDDLRITKGVALYTSNFTPPTAPLGVLSHDSSLIQFRNGDSTVIERNISPPIPTGDWSHIAAVRSSGVLKLFYNGNQVGSDASFDIDITRNNSNGISIGAYLLSNGTKGDYFSGYLDDLRITKNVARYTSNFDVPIIAFPDSGPPSIVPSEPLNLTTSENQGVVSLSWTRPVSPKVIDTRAPITSYSVEYSNDNQNTWTISNIPTDLDYNKVVLSLLMNGENNSTTFIDSSINTKTISVTNNAKLSTSQSKFGGSAAYFDGSSYISAGNSSDWNLSTGDFTIEGWVYNAGAGSYRGIIGSRGNTQPNGWCLYIHPDNTFYTGSIIGGQGYSDRQLNTTTVEANTWTHFALVKTSAGYRLYVNGVSGSLLALGGGFDYQSSQSLVIGALGSQGELPFLGYIDDVRITKGLARYNNNFDVSTLTQTPTNSINNLTPNNIYSFRVRAQNSIGFGNYSNISQIITPQLSPIIVSAIPDDSQAFISWDPSIMGDNYYSNISLLLKADSSSIVDSSPSPKTISVVNVPVSSTQSKFGGSSLYLSPSNVSSYLSFSQSNDFNFGTGDFTIEFWIYPNSTNSIRRWVNNETANGITIRGGTYNGGRIEIYTLDSSYNYSFINSSSISVGQWQHIAVVRYNGTIYAYKDGSYIGSINVAYPINMNGFILGGNGGEMPDCYIDEFRITKGVARYTSTTNSFTVPTTQFLTYPANTSAIRDYAMQYSSDAGTSWTNYAHSPSADTLMNVTGLNNGLDYVFRVAAVNLAGTGVYSSNSSSINVAPRTDNLYNKTRILLHLDSNQ